MRQSTHWAECVVHCFAAIFPPPYALSRLSISPSHHHSPFCVIPHCVVTSMSTMASETTGNVVESASGRTRTRKRPRSASHPATASASADVDVEGPIVDGPISPPPPPSSSSGSLLPDSVRGKPLDASSLAYFRSLHSSLQAAVDRGEDVQLMVAAAYGELKGLEYRLLVNKHGSRCIETLIAHSSPSQLASLLTATQTAAFPLLSDRNASHPMQRLIDKLPSLLMDEQRAGRAKLDDPASLTASLLAFCQSLSDPPSSDVFASAASPLSAPPSSSWPLLLTAEQGSFALRSLARLMSGVADDTASSDKDRHRHRHRADSLPASSSSSSASVSVSHLSFLRPVLGTLVDSIVGLKEADRIELSFHSTAAPALSQLLSALSAHPHYQSLLESMVRSLLLTSMEPPAALDGDGDESDSQSAVSVSSSGISHVAQLIRHRVGSHLLEHLLKAARHIPSAPESEHLTFATLLRDTLQADLAALALHSTGNHVLQAALALAGHSERKFIKHACSALAAHFHQLIESNRAGVIWRLLQASAFVSQKRRDRLVEMLRQALQADSSQALLHALLTLNANKEANKTDTSEDTADTDNEAATATPTEKKGRASDHAALHSAEWSPPRRVSYFGSLLLQSLLSLPLSDSSLSAAVLALPTDSLYALACDGSGGPVIESLLRVHTASSFSHPLSTQQRLVDCLLPRVTELATSASGSYVVERMYAASDVSRKRSIAESLARDEKRLRHSKPAAMLMKKCRVGGANKAASNKDWLVAEDSRRRKAELFSDILND